jgi:di/tricarboxylate transporter
MDAAVQSTSTPGETLEQPANPTIAAIGQFLCVALPIIIWFAPLNLEPQTQHAFAIVAFMVVAWITQAMDYALAGFMGASCSGRLVSSDSRSRFPALPTTRPGFCSAPS